MALTDKQKQLAQRIDSWVTSIEETPIGDIELFQKAWTQAKLFKELSNMSTKEQMNELCEAYYGLNRYEKLIQLLAEGVRDGIIKLPKAD